MLEDLAERAHARGWTLEVDVPFWLHERTDVHGGRLLVEVVEVADAVTVLTYRDSAERIVELGVEEMQAGAALATPVRLAVTVDPHPHDWVTFYEEGEAYMEGELDEVDEAHRAAPAYAGVGIHAYDHYADMAP